MGEIKGVREGLQREIQRQINSGVPPKVAEKTVMDRAPAIDRKIREGKIEKPR